MTNAHVWDIVWARLNIAFLQLKTDVQSRCPESWCLIERVQSALYPFGVVASFGVGNPQTDLERVSISFSVRVDSPDLVVSSDVARGGGYVLENGPTGRFSVAMVEAEGAAAFSGLIERMVLMIKLAKDVVVRELVGGREA